MWERLEPYKSSLILLLALTLGGLLGIYAPDVALKLQAVGKIFLNLLFMIIVPLVSVSVMSSIAGMTDLKKLGRIMGVIFAVSILMALIPAAGIVGLATLFDPAQGVVIELTEKFKAGSGEMDFVSMVTTNDFIGLLSKSNILALIIMSVIAGIAIGQSGEQGKRIAGSLNDLNTVIIEDCFDHHESRSCWFGLLFCFDHGEPRFTTIDHLRSRHRPVLRSNLAVLRFRFHLLFLDWRRPSCCTCVLEKCGRTFRHGAGNLLFAWNFARQHPRRQSDGDQS